MERKARIIYTPILPEGYQYNVHVLVCADGQWFYGGFGRFCKNADEAKEWIEKNGLDVLKED